MAWLLRIARNKSVDLLTRRATKPMRAVTSLDDPNLSQIAAMQSDAEIQLDREYRWELFNQAAEEAKKVVSEQTWKAFWMTTVESVSIEDAARILQVRPGVIYLSRCRVMERIKQLICKWEAGYDE
jgi:RNA polymerase sigma-70 factor (ECF subfamily)